MTSRSHFRRNARNDAMIKKGLTLFSAEEQQQQQQQQWAKHSHATAERWVARERLSQSIVCM